MTTNAMLADTLLAPEAPQRLAQSAELTTEGYWRPVVTLSTAGYPIRSRTQPTCCCICVSMRPMTTVLAVAR